jgi:hypothetical protein
LSAAASLLLEETDVVEGDRSGHGQVRRSEAREDQPDGGDPAGIVTRPLQRLEADCGERRRDQRHSVEHLSGCPEVDDETRFSPSLPPSLQLAVPTSVLEANQLAGCVPSALDGLNDGR